jgi:hypothetical protein
MSNSTATMEGGRRQPRSRAAASPITKAIADKSTTPTPVVVDISGPDNPASDDRHQPRESKKSPLPTRSTEEMIEAFRRERQLHQTMAEPERVVEKIIAATGPGSLVQDVLTATDPVKEPDSTDKSEPTPQ